MFWRRKKRSPADFAEEIRSHIALEADHLNSGALTPPEARAAARKAFGNLTAAEERFYERGRLVWFHDLLQDVRYGLRAMRKNAGFTAAAVLTLALGMGANTAIFSLIDATLLRSLPVKDPAGLYFLRNAGALDVGEAPPYPCFQRFRSLAKSFSGIAAYATNDFGVRIDGPIEQVDGSRVSANYYDVLGVTPFAGRLLTQSDERLQPPAAVISYQFWRRRFAADPGAIGKTFALDGVPGRFTIVGITPPDFHGLTPGWHDDVTMPFGVSDRVLRSNSSWFFKAIGRLAPGASPDTARAEIDPIFQVYMNQFPPSPDARRDHYSHMVLTPAAHGLDDLRQRFSRPLWALMAVVGLVLLIGCANITNLLLARAAARDREFAVRVAIGAGRGRLFRQVLVETGLLFFSGAVVGLAFAWWAAHGLIAFFAGGARPVLLDIHWDWRVTAFTAALSLLATLVFGAAPVLRAMRAAPHAAMKDGARATHSRIGSGQFLVAFQVALSMILLAGAALFLRTLDNLYTLGAAFHAEQVALVLIHLPDASYHESSARIALWDRLLPDIRSLPGVRSAALSRLTPMDGNDRGVGFDAPGFQSRSDSDRSINLNTVSEDYFATLGTPILQGRDFTAADRVGAPNVALLNESARKHFFGDRDPIGVVVRLMGRPQYRIIGVVQDAKQADLRKEAGWFVYVPVRQPIDSGSWLTLSIRTAADPQPLLLTVQRRLRALGQDIHIVRTNTLARQLDESLLQERLISTLATAFGLLALALSAVGLYGVLAYSVARRTSEIGIRMALGAMPAQVTWSILRQTLTLVAIGVAIGVPASILLAKLVENLFYGVTPTDPLTQSLAAAVLTAVALLASYVPAHKAGQTDPQSALRHE